MKSPSSLFPLSLSALIWRTDRHAKNPPNFVFIMTGHRAYGHRAYGHRAYGHLAYSHLGYSHLGYRHLGYRHLGYFENVGSKD